MNPTTTRQLELTCIAKRPDLLPIITKWLWREWWENRGFSAEETQAMYSKGQVEVGAPQTLVLMVDDVPVGTASLALQDLEERPDLTPWLAGVFVIPEMRGRGYAYRLLEAFDEACYAASIDTAWLYTSNAERLYLKAGWQIAQTIERPTKRPVTLMRRSFSKQQSPAARHIRRHC
jgi:GNAT superfamily N-acetyltransferase